MKLLSCQSTVDCY